jgi:hypothetical protein
MKKMKLESLANALKKSDHDEEIMEDPNKVERVSPDEQTESARIEILNNLPLDLTDLLDEAPLDELKVITAQFHALPENLQNFWVRKWTKQPEDPKKIIEDLNWIINNREKEGLIKIVGFHVSNKDLTVGSFLETKEGTVFYSEDLKNLYGRYGGGWLYIVDGHSSDSIVDKNIGWRTLSVGAKILDKIRLDDDSQKKLGWEFAKCEYH